MLTFVLVVAQPGRRIDESVRTRLQTRRPEDVPFEPDARVQWSDRDGHVFVAGWQDAAAPAGRHWHEHDDGLTLFTGDPWPRGQKWTPGVSWAAQISGHLGTLSGASDGDDLLGLFALVSLDAAGHGDVVGDPFGVAHLYWGANEHVTVISSRAPLAARVLADAGRTQPRRDAFGTTWLAFAECQQGSATGDAGVEVVAPGARIEIRGGGPVRVVPPRPRHWTFAAPPADLDLFDDVRADIATLLHRAVHEPVGRRLVGLTGGRDSRTILAVILEEGLADEFEFETLGSPDLPDVVVARDVAAKFGLNHHVGGSGSGRALRVVRTAALRSEHPGVSDREIAMRLQVGMGAGMRSLVHPFLGHPAVGDQVSVSGYCGEALRTNYAGATWVRTREQVLQFPLLGLKFGGAGILLPDAQARYEHELRAMILDEIGDDEDARDILDAWYLRNRYRRWLGPDHEFNAENAIYPLYSTIGVRVAYAIGPADRRADRIPYEIIRRALPALADEPFQDGGWSTQVTEHPIGWRPDPPAQSTLRSTVGRLTKPVREAAKPGKSAPKLGIRTVGADQRRARAAEDAEIMLRYFRESSNPMFDIVDQPAVLDRVEHFEELPETARRQLYGALTAAIWLGGHELTYP